MARQLNGLPRSLARLLVAAAIAVGCGQVGFISDATAYSCQGETYGSRWDGFGAFNAHDGTGNTFEGVQTYIENGDMSNCTSTDEEAYNFVTTWNMIAGNSLHSYAQAGFFRPQGDCIYWYAEYHNQIGSGDYTRKVDISDGCRSGSGQTFQTRYDPSAGREIMIAGSTPLLRTDYNPYAYWNEPFVPEISGESKYAASDLPGSVSNPTELGDTILQRYDHSWTTTSIGFPAVSDLCNRPARYRHNQWSDHTFYIWTDGTDYGDYNC